MEGAEQERHDRYDELAVGHVLGGLDPVDAAEFRSHLVGCRSCRLRVAELRDLAAELATAEREERAAARLKTELRGEDESGAADLGEEGPEVAGGWRRSLPLVAIVSVAVIVAGSWAYQIRTQNEELLEVTERREATLALLAEGEQVATTFRAGVSGPVMVDPTRVGLSLAGLPDELPEGHVLALWLRDVDGRTRLLDAFETAPRDGRLALHAVHDGATTLLVTVQPVGMETPAERPLVRAELHEPLDP